MSDTHKTVQIEEETNVSMADIATMLKALGEPTRLRIFQFLRSCCCPVAIDEATGDVHPVSGPTVGEVCCHITGRDKITSTISEHLKDLRLARLILIERRGKHMICAVNPAALATLSSFLSSDDSVTASEQTRKETIHESCC